MKNRYGRLKRFLRGMFYAVVVLAVIHAGITLWAGRRLEAKLNELREAGEPVAMADLAGPDIPADENGATYLKQAAEIMKKVPGNEEKQKAYQAAISRDAEEHAKTDWPRLGSVLGQYDGVVRLLEKAMACKQCRLPVDWKSNDISAISESFFPSFADVREFARLLSARSALAAHNGDTAEALRRAAKVLRLSECLKDEPTLIAQLVRYAIVDIGTKQMESAAASGPVTVEAAKAAWEAAGAIDMSSSMTTAMRGERTFIFSAYPLIRRSPRSVFALVESGETPRKAGLLARAGDRMMGYLISPLAYVDQMHYIELSGRQVKATEESVRDVLRHSEEVDSIMESIPRYAIFARVLAPVVSRAIANQIKAQANIEGCKGLAAVQAYRTARGSYPGTLAEACSLLGREAPLDPYTGKALLYRRTADGFLLYSVGENLADDGGKPPSRKVSDKKDWDLVWSSNPQMEE